MLFCICSPTGVLRVCVSVLRRGSFRDGFAPRDRASELCVRQGPGEPPLRVERFGGVKDDVAGLHGWPEHRSARSVPGSDFAAVWTERGGPVPSPRRALVRWADQLVSVVARSTRCVLERVTDEAARTSVSTRVRLLHGRGSGRAAVFSAARGERERARNMIASKCPGREQQSQRELEPSPVGGRGSCPSGCPRLVWFGFHECGPLPSLWARAPHAAAACAYAGDCMLIVAGSSRSAPS